MANKIIVPQMKPKSIESYYKMRGWKVGHNKPSFTTANGKLAYEVWNNVLAVECDIEAIKYLMAMRQEIKNK